MISSCATGFFDHHYQHLSIGQLSSPGAGFELRNGETVFVGLASLISGIGWAVDVRPKGVGQSCEIEMMDLGST